jgi:hypothetical protein
MFSNCLCGSKKYFVYVFQKERFNHIERSAQKNYVFYVSIWFKENLPIW